MDEITPITVRDALVSCFHEAHCADTGLEANTETDNQYCLSIVKKAFADAGGNFDNPTKEEIIKVVGLLAEFSKNFRSQEIIAKHQQQIMELLKQLGD